MFVESDAVGIGAREQRRFVGGSEYGDRCRRRSDGPDDSECKRFPVDGSAGRGGGAVRNALERTPPELSADIIDKGIILAGGGSLLKNLDKRLREETGLPVAHCEEPGSAVVRGTGMMLTNIDLLRKIAIA